MGGRSSPPQPTGSVRVPLLAPGFTRRRRPTLCTSTDTSTGRLGAAGEELCPGHEASSRRSGRVRAPRLAHASKSAHLNGDDRPSMLAHQVGEWPWRRQVQVHPRGALRGRERKVVQSGEGVHGALHNPREFNGVVCKASRQTKIC